MTNEVNDWRFSQIMIVEVNLASDKDLCGVCAGRRGSAHVQGWSPLPRAWRYRRGNGCDAAAALVGDKRGAREQPPPTKVYEGHRQQVNILHLPTKTFTTGTRRHEKRFSDRLEAELGVLALHLSGSLPCFFLFFILNCTEYRAELHNTCNCKHSSVLCSNRF